MHDYVLVLDTDERKIPEPVGNHEAFRLVEMVAVQDVLDGPVPSKIMGPVVIPHAGIEPVLEDDVVVADDGPEVLQAHEKAKCLHGILPPVAEITYGIEDVRIRVV